ncbi:MAG: leucyl/phenylalanyl-tRNA--protein transferase [Planctomycetota bacterium]|nr:leucyl/phenylalanyl-tRNA--protein transferase [Planctomycetota bacterium]
MWRRPVWLDDESPFPPVERADSHGLLAVGGTLTPERVVDAYRRGIFPWPTDEHMPVLWWSPDPRCVLRPRDLRVSRSLEQRLRSGRFDVRFDTAFEAVMRACGEVARPGQDGTWITDEMVSTYVTLHERGFAHSVESWRDGKLVGGLYGVALDGVFSGESMFYRERDASKVAFVTLMRRLQEWNFDLVDCQMETEHPLRFGATTIPRTEFLKALGGSAHTSRWGRSDGP